MKTAGIIIFTIDLLKTLYTGITKVTQEKDVDLEEFEPVEDNQHSIGWRPYIGIGMMVIGSALFMLGRKKSMTA